MNFQSLVVTLLGRTAYFDPALASAALLGVVWRGRFYSRKFYSFPLERLIYSHWCLVLQGLSKHLGYFLLLDYQLCPIWTFNWGVHSNIDGPFIFWCLWHFWRKLQSGQQIFSIASARSGVSVPSYLFGGLRSCRRVLECLTTFLAEIISGGSWSSQGPPWFSVFSEALVRTDLRLQATSQEVWFLTSVVLVSRLRRFFQAAYLLSGGILSVVSSVLRVFYCRFILSRSDFTKISCALAMAIIK